MWWYWRVLLVTRGCQAPYCRILRLRISALIWIALLFATCLSQAAPMACKDPDSCGSPQQDIRKLCRKNQWTCFVDLTSSAPCRMRPHRDGEDLVEYLAKACPEYAWEAIDGVHVFGPKNTKDSKLNVSVGPIDEYTDPGDLLRKLTSSAGLPEWAFAHATEARGGGNVAESLSELKFMAFADSLRTTHPPFVDKQLRGQFMLRRGPFRDAVIRAGREFGPSFWKVECSKDDRLGENCESWVDDYDDLTERGYLSPHEEIYPRYRRRPS